MAKFPEPPTAERLAEISPEILTFAAGQKLWRVYLRGGRHPTFWDAFRSWGPTQSRFDHQLPPSRLQERKILYGAIQGPTCLAELFQQTRVIDRTAHAPWIVCFELTRCLRLLDITGTWPTRAGASMALATGPRPRAQRWSRAIYAAYADIEGICYPSSMLGNQSAVALYERAAGALPDVPQFHRPLSDPALLPLLRSVARDIGYGLV